MAKVTKEERLAEDGAENPILFYNGHNLLGKCWMQVRALIPE